MTDIADQTGQIRNIDGEHIVLEPGYYLVAYQVSGLFEAGGYFQIIPHYNDASFIVNGIYFMTGAWMGEGRFSGSGSANFIVYAPEATRFFLTYNSNTTVTEVQTTMTIRRLNRGV